MVITETIQKLTKEFADSLPPIFKTENKQAQLQTLLSNWLSQLNLVTREEFDIQTNVLLRTRLKLEKLEEEVKKLQDKRKQL